LKTALNRPDKVLYIAFIAVLIFLNPLTIREARATHGVGAELTYRCMGGNLYEFTLKYYRDCRGVAMPQTQLITIASVSCGITSTLTLNKVGVGEDISPLCTSALSECAGGTEPGVEKYVYQNTFTLPLCPDWVFSFEQCCRNVDITNLVNPNAQFLYIRSTLDNSGGICNTSPMFTTSPVPYICDNQLVNYNMGTFDPDGDSLHYTLVNALGSNGLALTYVSGYTPTYPISTTSGSVNFDSNSGNLKINPDSIQVCIITVLVEEYRNGTLIGSVMRDIQVRVLDCPTNLVPFMSSPGIKNHTGGSLIDSNTVRLCAGTAVNFDIEGSDLNANDTLTMTTNLSLVIPGATFSTTGVLPIQGSFSWVPTAADSGIHIFTVTIQDDACPILGMQSYDFEIIVDPSTDAGPDDVYCSGGVPVQLNAVGGSDFMWTPNAGLSCSNCPNPIAAPSATTVYFVTSNLGGACQKKDSLTVTVVADFNMTLTPKKDTICANESVQLDILTDSLDGPFTYEWQNPNGDLSDPNIANPMASPTSTTVYSVMVTAGSGCTQTDALEILVSGIAPIVTVTPMDTSICAGESVQLEAVATADPSYCLANLAFACNGPVQGGQVGTGTLSDGEISPFTGAFSGARSQYLYLATDLNSAGFNAGTIQEIGWNILAKNSGSFDSVTIALGCTSIDNLDSNSWQPTTPVCRLNSFNTIFGTGMIPLDNTYNWDGISNLIVEVCFSTSPSADDSVEYANTAYIATVNSSSSSFGGCSLTPDVAYKKLPNLSMSICQSTMSFPYYVWTPDGGLSNDSIANPIASPSSTTTYTVTVGDSSSTCTGTGITTINVGADFSLTTSNNTTICFGDTLGISSSPDIPGVYTYYWWPPVSISDTSIRNPAVYPTDSIRYYVSVSNGACVKIDSVTVNVSGRSLIAGADPPVICSGTQTVYLSAVGLGSPSTCGASPGLCVDGIQFDVGSGSVSNSSTAYPAPYGNWYKNAKHQILYLASDLQSAGLVAGTINSLAFDVAAINGATQYKNFALKMGCTSTSDLSTWKAGLIQVFSPQTITLTTGWNVHSFDANYDWDGISNIVVEVCFDNRDDLTSTLNSSTFYTVTGYNSVIYFRSDVADACLTSSIPDTSRSRPNIRFNLCYSDTSLPVGYAYSWTPIAGLSAPTTQSPIATISGPSTYTVAITDLNGCVYNESVFIDQNIVSASIVNVSNIGCSGSATGSATGRLTGGTPPYTYIWSDPSAQTDSTATGLVAGAYTVKITDKYGCSDSTGVVLFAPLAPLSGTYTIGGLTPTPNFTDWTQAVDALNQQGISGPVIFNVRSGNYVEQIEIDSICGASSVNTVTFQSEALDSTMVTLGFSATTADNFTVRLNNADFVTFRLITLAATNTSSGRVVELINGASNIRLANNIIMGVNTSSTLNTRALVYQVSGSGQNNVFSNNVFLNGSHGIYTTTTEPGMLITDNQLSDQYYGGLWLQNKSAVEVSNNVIETNSSGPSYYGIYLSNCDGAIEVESNKITTATTSGYGILLYNCDGVTGDRGLISNNFIQLGTSGKAYGIYMSTDNNLIDVYHNSIHITSANSTTAQPFYSRATGGNINVINNIFSNTGGGYCVYINNDAVISNMNFNDHYTTGGILGYNAGITYGDLASWQAGTGRDSNSVSVDPIFTTVSDLHLTVNSPDTLKSGFNLLADVPKDIDDTLRDPTPWMGAHENNCNKMSIVFTTNNNMCAGDSTGSITVTVAGGGVPPYGYLWDDPAAQTNSTASNLKAGLYQVMITDSRGCKDSITDAVADPLPLVPTIIDSTGLTCFGSNDGSAIVQISGGTIPYQFLWSPSGIANDTAIGLSSGVHTVTITDSNNCSTADSVTIDEPALLIVTIVDSADISCNGLTDGFAVADAIGGTSPYNFVWYPSGIVDDTASVLDTGSNWVIVTDISGCSDSVGLTVFEPPPLVADAGSSVVICPGESSQLGAAPTATGGVGPYSYLWDPGNSLDDAALANPTASPILTTLYQLILTDSNGCVSTDSVQVFISPDYTTPASDTICSNDSILLGGAYQNTAGTYTDTLQASNGCDSIVTTTLIVNPAYEQLLYDTICDGDSVQIAGIWRTASGVYPDSLISIEGCDSVEITDLLVGNPITLSVTAVNAQCDSSCDGQGFASASGGTGVFSFLWSTVPAQTDSTAGSLCAGTYTVTVTDANGCIATDNITLTAPTLLTANMTGMQR